MAVAFAKSSKKKEISELIPLPMIEDNELE
jgi:hypothetical protein